MNSLVMRSSLSSTELTRLRTSQSSRPFPKKIVSVLGLVLCVALATKRRREGNINQIDLKLNVAAQFIRDEVIDGDLVKLGNNRSDLERSRTLPVASTDRFRLSLCETRVVVWFPM